jgi:hypothetical protein
LISTQAQRHASQGECRSADCHTSPAAACNHTIASVVIDLRWRMPTAECIRSRTKAMNRPGLTQSATDFGRRERRQRKAMAKLGIPDFEMVQQCGDRQQQMGRRFERAGELQDEAEWAECETEFCAATPCRDGCWFASRRHRYQMITEGHRLLSDQTESLHFVTITHPRWELPIGRLAEANIPAVRQWLYRRSRQLGTSAIAVGGFEASLNIELDGSSTWAGHVHLVVAGTDKQRLRKAFQIEKHYRVESYLRPVDIRDVDCLGRQLGYSLKRIARRRVAYIDGQGRQNRNQSNLSSSEQREFDGWLLGLPVGARTILIGCRAHGRKLRLVNGRGAP